MNPIGPPPRASGTAIPRASRTTGNPRHCSPALAILHPPELPYAPLPREQHTSVDLCRAAPSPQQRQVSRRRSAIFPRLPRYYGPPCFPPHCGPPCFPAALRSPVLPHRTAVPRAGPVVPDPRALTASRTCASHRRPPRRRVRGAVELLSPCIPPIHGSSRGGPMSDWPVVLLPQIPPHPPWFVLLRPPVLVCPTCSCALPLPPVSTRSTAPRTALPHDDGYEEP